MGRSMSKSRHTGAQIIGALKQLEAGRKAEDVAREEGVSKHTIYAWKAKYGGMDVSRAQEPVRGAEEDRGVARGIQPGAAAQQPRLSDAGGDDSPTTAGLQQGPDFVS